MKLNFLIIFFLIKAAYSFKAPNNRELSEIRAINDVLSSLFDDFQIDFDILFIGKVTNRSKDIIDRIRGNFTRQLIVKSFPLKISKSAVIFYNGAKELNKILTKTKLNNDFYKKLRFLAIDGSKTKAKSVDVVRKLGFRCSLSDENGTITQFMYYLTKSHKKIELWTFEYFGKYFCAYAKFKILNTFTLNSSKWQKAIKFDEKFENLYNCTLIAYANGEYYINVLGKHTKVFIGHIFDVIAQIGNFSIAPMWHRDVQILQNQTRGSFKPHLFLQTHIIQPRIKEFFSTMAFYDCTWLFIITPASAFTSFEKMLKPFDFLTWIFLISTFLIAFCTIFFVNRLPSMFQDIFYGEKIKMPCLNVISTFFGIAQKKLPENNFGRMILMFFVIFCLIFRTAYQGELKFK